MGFGSYTIIDCRRPYEERKRECSSCEERFQKLTSQMEADQRGLSCAICDDTLYQIVSCTGIDVTTGLYCDGYFVLKCPLQDPMIDMGSLIMMPHSNPILNVEEQIGFLTDYDKWPTKLKFGYIKAWNTGYISNKDVLEQNTFQAGLAQIKAHFEIDNYLLHSSEKHVLEFLHRQEQEERYLLKRFYPNNDLYNALIACIAPRQLTSLEPIPYPPIPEEQFEKQKSAFLYLLEYYYGESIYDAIEKKLIKHEITELEGLAFEIDQQIYTKLHTTNNDLYLVHENMLKNDYEAIKSLFKTYFENIYHPVCTERFLSEQREELSKWTEHAEKGSALFVDAPMGIGKTYSISEGIASQPDSSAVIFMPTKRLCKEMRIELALKIAKQSKTHPSIEDLVPMDHDNPQLKFDEDGEVVPQYNEEFFLKQGIYLFDGINEKECLHYKKIIDRYKSRYYRKKDICDECSIKKTCRFLKHRENLKDYRIIITTHFMYDFFYNNISYSRWENLPKQENKPKPIIRDYFIIDEDFIVSKCYQPIVLSEAKLINFVSTLTKLFTDVDFLGDNEVDREYFQKTDLILGLVAKTEESSIIPPIDPDFEYPKLIKNIWSDSLKEQEELIPESLMKSNRDSISSYHIGDYVEIIENAIRKGFVVQVRNLQKPKRKITSVLLANPKRYSFAQKEFPAHIFFDGTKLEKKYIKEKLIDMKIKPMKIEIKNPLWDFKVWQNINTDLPKNRMDQNKTKIEEVLTRIITTHGKDERYFILTNKNQKGKIKEFLSKKFTDYYFVVEYFGNLRGLNNAKKCNVGIILGSLILPDTVEIAMAFDFICENFKTALPYPKKLIGNIYSWQGSIGIKKYKEDFIEIEDFSKMYRHSEYRQALARTRYLSHSVTFYIFSKDDISSYEPFVSKIESSQYSDDIFPDSPKRSDNKDAIIEEKVNEWLNQPGNNYITGSILNTEYGIRRQTAGEHLKRMYAEGKISLMKGHKKRYCKIIIVM